MKRCARPGCGHDEDEHAGVGPGECYAYAPPHPVVGTLLCTCEAFLDEPPAAEPDELPLSAAVAGVIAELGETLEPVLEAVNGYRSKLLGLGYPADAAASMAADYHRMLLAAFSRPSSDERRTT